MIERLSGDEFLDKLEKAVAWDFDTTRDLEMTLLVKDAEGNIIAVYLEPSTQSMDFDEYMRFAQRVYDLSNNPELKGRRKV